MYSAPRDESLEDKIRRVVAEEILVVPYDPRWPKLIAEDLGNLDRAFKGYLRRL